MPLHSHGTPPAAPHGFLPLTFPENFLFSQGIRTTLLWRTGFQSVGRAFDPRRTRHFCRGPGAGWPNVGTEAQVEQKPVPESRTFPYAQAGRFVGVDRETS